MKYIKLFENKNTEDKLKEYDIRNYTINSDGTIDVKGDVNLRHYGLSEIPFKFGKVSGDFLCAGNSLINLIGCPKEVGGDFDAYGNELISLEGGPEEVGGFFDCSDNKLTTLKFCPSEVGSSFNCSNNKLRDIDISSIIGGELNCEGNKIKKNYSFYGEVGGEILI